MMLKGCFGWGKCRKKWGCSLRSREFFQRNQSNPVPENFSERSEQFCVNLLQIQK